MAEEILLNYLGSSYFHQDYDLEAPTPAALVKRFAEEEEPDYAQILVDELRSMLASGVSESMARDMWLRDAEASYDPASEGKSYLSWLNEVVTIVETVLAEKRQEGEIW